MPTHLSALKLHVIQQTPVVCWLSSKSYRIREHSDNLRSYIHAVRHTKRESYKSSTAFTTPNLLAPMYFIHTTHSSLHLLLPNVCIATTASAIGISEATIKILRRCRSIAYQQYVRPSTSTLVVVVPRLLSSASSVNQTWAHSILVDSTDYTLHLVLPSWFCFLFLCVLICAHALGHPWKLNVANGASSLDALQLVTCPLNSITSRVQMAPG